MELIIRNTTNQPIYDQIYSQIKAQIIAGKLSPGEALPSIRALAKDLRISTSLDGVTYTTLGDYVLGNTAASDFTAQQIAFSSLARYVRFDLFSNYEDGIYTGLSEVQFQGASAGAVPEPAAWAMMITGFGLAGTALRRRRSIAAAAA